MANGLRQVALPRPWWAEKERVFSLRDEAASGQVVDQRAVHPLVEIEIKSIERALRVAEARLFVPALEEAVLPTQELVGHEHRDQIDRRELLGLGMPQARFEDGRHARTGGVGGARDRARRDPACKPPAIFHRRLSQHPQSALDMKTILASMSMEVERGPGEKIRMILQS